MELYNKLAKTPKEALKTIQGGRLNGKSSIDPQYRYKLLTETFGPCGIGWKPEIVKTDIVNSEDGQVIIYMQVNLYINYNGKWSEPIPGIGGDFCIKKEKGGLHYNDEAYKMAYTDAIGNATRLIGVAADVYEGKHDGDKYLKSTSNNISVNANSNNTKVPENYEGMGIPMLKGLLTNKQKEKDWPKIKELIKSKGGTI